MSLGLVGFGQAHLPGVLQLYRAGYRLYAE